MFPMRGYIYLYMNLLRDVDYKLSASYHMSELQYMLSYPTVIYITLAIEIVK